MMSSPAQKNGPLFSPGFQKQKEQILYNISEINKNTKKLKENDKAIGTKKDTPDLRKKIQEVQSSTNLIIKETFSTMRASVSGKLSSAESLQSERLFAQFNSVAEKYIQCKKALNVKMKNSVPVVPDELSSISYEPREQQVHFSMQLNVVKSVEQDVLKIEEDITDISQMMQQLKALVYEQGDFVDNTEKNVDETHYQVQTAVVELRGVETYQNSNRKKILIVVALCVIIVVVILIITLK